MNVHATHDVLSSHSLYGFDRLRPGDFERRNKRSQEHEPLPSVRSLFPALLPARRATSYQYIHHSTHHHGSQFGGADSQSNSDFDDSISESSANSVALPPIALSDVLDDISHTPPVETSRHLRPASQSHQDPDEDSPPRLPADMMTASARRTRAGANASSPTPSADAADARGKKKHLCALCGARFARPSELKLHSHKHTGERGPFTCTVCKRHFSTQFNLGRHMRTIHIVAEGTGDGSGEGFELRVGYGVHANASVPRQVCSPAPAQD